MHVVPLSFREEEPERAISCVSFVNEVANVSMATAKNHIHCKKIALNVYEMPSDLSFC